MKRNSVCLLLMLAAFAFTSARHAQASSFQVIYTFHGTDGEEPYAPMIADSAGNLYGTTEFGGSQQWGTVFKLTKGAGGTWTETTLYNFSNGPDGGEPAAEVVMDAAGNLYGTTTAGGDAACVTLHGYCGVVYKLTLNLDGSYTESVLVDFTGTNGLNPVAGLTFDEAGNLYGTTSFGGTTGDGTVFELTPTGGSWTETILHNFAGADGRQPNSTLRFDSLGNLYGTTNIGGNLKACSDFGCGEVYELKPSGGSWTIDVLHRFNGTNGANPKGLAFDASGNMFGSTATGGSGTCDGFLAPGCGLVYELSPVAGGWSEKLITNFTTVVSAGPNPVVLDAAGNIYGTSIYGGLKNCDSGSGCGTVFEIEPKIGGGWNFTGLYGFGLNKNGGFPYAALNIDGSGNIYGSTGSGGDLNCEAFGGCGVVFQITP